MKISIVTVCYNAEKVIEKTILSVINQTYKDLEYIIIDGNSTDGTIDIIKKYANRIVYWVSEPDGGIYDAMNKGIRVATGEWINFMNAGDLFINNNILESINFENISSKTHVIYGDNIRLYNSGKRGYHKGHPIKTIKKRIVGCHQSIFISLANKKEIYFNIRYKLCADYDQVYNIYLRYGACSFLYMPIPISAYDIEGGVSSLLKKECCKEKMAIHIKNGEYISMLFDLLMLICLKIKIK